MRSAPSMSSLPGPFLPGVVATDKRPIYGLNRTKPGLSLLLLFFAFKQRIYAKLNYSK